MARWLAKSEPDVYGIDDLSRDGSTTWEGVRNFTARNFLRAMQVGDLVLFYHSNAVPSGVAGVCRILATASPNPTQFDPASAYYDDTAPADGSRWSWVTVAFVERFASVVSLADIKANPMLEGIEVARKGSRLSVCAVSDAHFDHIVARGRRT